MTRARDKRRKAKAPGQRKDRNQEWEQAAIRAADAEWESLGKIQMRDIEAANRRRETRSDG